MKTIESPETVAPCAMDCPEVMGSSRCIHGLTAGARKFHFSNQMGR